MIKLAATTPHQSHGLFRYRRFGVRSKPPATPKTRRAIVYLVIMPTPIAPPIAIHQRGSSDLSQQITKYATGTHHK